MMNKIKAGLLIGSVIFTFALTHAVGVELVKHFVFGRPFLAERSIEQRLDALEARIKGAE